MSLRSLPSVDSLAGELRRLLPRGLAVEVARSCVDAARASIGAGEEVDVTKMAMEQAQALRSRRPQRIINATGVLLHTNLGRAPIHLAAAEAAATTATSYGNVEFDLASGQRGGRGQYLARLIQALTGAESAHVVNNNAAALLLALAALSPGKSVPVSRGELIEIGGSYRLPDLMSVSTANLLEVGTTNRTRLSDYERVIGSDTGLVLKVHPSNYRIVGFAEEVDLDGLIELSRSHDVPSVYDVGSGLLDAEVPWAVGPPPPWLTGEPGVRQELERGFDLVLFSGDKLLGGPQAGIIAGSERAVSAMKNHPLARALRIDGATMSALVATLEIYLDGRGSEIPFWRSALAATDALQSRLERLGHSDLEIEPGASLLGAGSVPGLEVPTPVGRIPEGGHLWSRLLRHDPPVLARRDQGDLIIDVRAVPADDDAVLEDALSELR